ncbi:MAG: MDR family oxidoreductase [Geminicoccaceae bacterium]
MSETFRAVLLDQADGKTTARIADMPVASLPEGDVLVDVAYSTLNYKDGLAITGAGKIIRQFPFVPGVDFSGRVAASDNPAFKPGDEVVLTGWGVGERHWGGLAQKARVKGDWLVPLPKGLTLKRAMAIGTAGFTAMLAVEMLAEQGITPERGEVVVTGAAGGVGSIAVALLAKRGFKVAAVSGRPELADELRRLGAAEILDRKTFSEPSKAPLDSARWAAAIDNVGGTTLAGLLRGMQQRGVVAACGNAGGVALETTVFPFILRGVRLVGIDSVYQPAEPRLRAWQSLVTELDPDLLDSITEVIPLAAVPEAAGRFLKGAVQGRLVVDVAA